MGDEQCEVIEEDEENAESGSSVGCQRIKMKAQPIFPYEVLEHVLAFVKSHKDRNTVSLVCKAWYKMESCTRNEVFIGNCYAVSPEIVVRRFPRIKSVILKGKPRFADFSLVPPNWGANLYPWIPAMAPVYRWLEKLYLKRMTVTDKDLSAIGDSFPNFKQLILVCCDGFTTTGLAMIASKCRYLTELTLNDAEVTNTSVDWIGCFPETTTSLVSLSFDCLECPINFDELERLVARSPFLKKLGLNRSVSIVQLQRLLLRAPQLTTLGTGSFGSEFFQEQGENLHAVFGNCKLLQCLSGFREIVPEYLPAIYPVCCNLTFLNFSFAIIGRREFEEVIRHCHKLQRLWVMDTVEDSGLHAAAETCRDLRDLRVFPVDVQENGVSCVSDKGLVAISEGCPNLESILYFCQQMTNAAVVTMSNNCQSLAVFRLCIMGRCKPDYITGEPMDEGFGAIVRNCKNLTRLAVSGLLTDKAFEYFGTFGKSLEILSVAFAGQSDLSMKYVLDGCKNLRKLEIRDSPFGDTALLSGLHHYESMRFLWMSDCKVTEHGCTELAKIIPSLNVEMIRENKGENDYLVEKLYVYRSVAGPRNDKPSFVITF
ncbi:hypothetical protein SUGI_0185150 [Cryptomeria japonica]|uniref:transport inhibitor response 1-like protein n=1 Tax=Cryptomeria japonica TaxID=3369 RepID=UPI002408ABF5|nr:transport inhibitor response 1-like protein [Cryptomeria japonica]GLJ12132.1 hypothetical protein SUGI_0185150 [Cryptomeria japonica]